MIDVLIVGGGLVGYSLARALRDTGRSIHLAEVASTQDQRPIALSYGSRRIFEAMGAWHAMAPSATPIREVHVSHQGFGTSRLKAGDLGLEALGYVVPARAIHRALARDLQVVRHRPARLEGLARGRGAMEAALSGGIRLKARLIAGADGGDSTLRRLLGIPARQRRFPSALVGTLIPACPHENVAFERFTPEGPIALLPLPGGRCGFVWCTSKAQALLEGEEEALCTAFQEAFGWHLGRIRSITPLGAYPLRTVKALRQTGERAVLLGNAARTLHPVAAQGFNLALRDVHALAQAIACHPDPGHPAALRRFLRDRRRDQRRTTALTEGLLGLFSPKALPLRAARSLGLVAFDLLPPAKRRLMHLGMGLQP